MILNIEKIATEHNRVSKFGKVFKVNRLRTVFTIQCDVCGRILTRSKGEAYKLELRDRHCCSPECIGKLTTNARWRDHEPRAARRKSGYVYVGNRREHQIAMEEELGRSLYKGEIVHHIDGDKGKNTIENLVLCESIQHHNRIHGQLEALAFLMFQQGKIMFCKSCTLYYQLGETCFCGSN
jgi:hypothetical protein